MLNDGVVVVAAAVAAGVDAAVSDNADSYGLPRVLWVSYGLLWDSYCGACLNQPPSNNNFCSGLSQPPARARTRANASKARARTYWPNDG